MNREIEIENKVLEYRSDLTVDEILEISPDWYVEAKKRATAEINKKVEDAREVIQSETYIISVNRLAQKGRFENKIHPHLNGALYLVNNEIIDFHADYLEVLPNEVIQGVKSLGYKIDNKKLMNK